MKKVLIFNLKGEEMKFFLILTFLLLNSTISYGFDENKIQTYLQLLKAGCSVDSKTDIKITADGKLMILKKAKIGGTSFDLKLSQKQDILNALKDDTLKGGQATEQRKCQQHYLDKIFDVIIPQQKNIDKKALSKISEGVVWELDECKKQGRSIVICKFYITSSYFDRKIYITSNMFDEFGNHYSPSSISLANYQTTNHSLSCDVIADVKTSGLVKFKNVNTQASLISKIVFNSDIDFRNIKLK